MSQGPSRQESNPTRDTPLELGHTGEGLEGGWVSSLFTRYGGGGVLWVVNVLENVTGR